MDGKPKTMIVTGASQGIGAGVTKASFDRGYNVVANSLHKVRIPAGKKAGVSGRRHRRIFRTDVYEVDVEPIDSGDEFAAREQPERCSEEFRAAFRSSR